MQSTHVPQFLVCSVKLGGNPAPLIPERAKCQGYVPQVLTQEHEEERHLEAGVVDALGQLHDFQRHICGTLAACYARPEHLQNRCIKVHIQSMRLHKIQLPEEKPNASLSDGFHQTY